MEHTQHLRARLEHTTDMRVAVYYGDGERVDHMVHTPGHTQALCGQYLLPSRWDTTAYSPGPVWDGRGRCKRCAALYAKAQEVDA